MESLRWISSYFSTTNNQANVRTVKSIWEQTGKVETESGGSVVGLIQELCRVLSGGDGPLALSHSHWTARDINSKVSDRIAYFKHHMIENFPDVAVNSGFGGGKAADFANSIYRGWAVNASLYRKRCRIRNPMTYMPTFYKLRYIPYVRSVSR